jgi:hypothetical protein
MTTAPAQQLITLPPLSELQQGGPWESVSLETLPSNRVWITMKNAEGVQPSSTIRTTNKQYFTGIYHYDYVLESKPQPVSIGTSTSTAGQSGGLIVVLADNSNNHPFTSMMETCKASQEYVSVAIINQTEKTASSKVIAMYGLVTHYGQKNNGTMFYFRLQVMGLVGITRPVYAEPGKAETAKGNLVGATYNCLEQAQAGSPLVKTLLTKFAQDSIKALK